MNFLITGASGFIGQAIIKELIKKSDIKIFAIIRPESYEKFKYKKNFKVNSIKKDIKDIAINDIEKLEIDTLIHTAWISTPGIYLNSKENYYHLKWSNQLTENLIKCNIKHITSLGTCFEYEESDELLSEANSELISKFPYTECKNKHHNYLKRICYQNKISYTWGRVFYPYGPGEPKDKFCSFVIRKLLRGETVQIKTPNDIKDYIYIKDLAKAIILVTQKKHKGPINLGTGQPISIKKLTEKICKLCNKDKKLITTLKQKTKSKIIADNKLLRQYRWQPKTNLKKGLKKMIQSIN